MFSFYNQKRFWSKVNVTTLNNCWNWTKYIDKDGYGTFYHSGSSTKAHRYVYLLYKGSIPQDYEVCHTCDNPACCNPNHLFVDTHAGNMSDMSTKGRSRISTGENNVNTTLKNGDIENLLDMILQRRLVSPQQIFQYDSRFTEHNLPRILRRELWKNVTDKYTDLQLEEIKDILRGVPTRDDIRNIQVDIKAGMTNVQLEKKYGWTRWLMSKIRNNKHKYT